MPNINLRRRSLFWKLSGLLVAFCLLMIWLSWSWGRYVETQNAFLSHDARSALASYAEQAERAWVRGGRYGVDAWLNDVSRRESGWIGVVGPDLQSLSSTMLTYEEVQHMTFLRGIDWPVSRRNLTPPWLKVAFPEDPRRGTLVIQLPERFMPGGYTTLWRILINGVIPAAFTLLLCAGLYRMLVVPSTSCASRPRPGAPISSTRACPGKWRIARMNWASWRGLSTRCPSACRVPSRSSSNCCATCPTSCARL